MNDKQKAALHQLGQAVRHHLNARQVAEGQGLIPPLGGQQQQPPQGAPQPQAGAPQPGQPQQPGAQPGQPPQPPMPNRQTLMSKAPPPIDPTQTAAVQNRGGRNSLMDGGFAGGMRGRSAAARAERL